MHGSFGRSHMAGLRPLDSFTPPPSLCFPSVFPRICDPTRCHVWLLGEAGFFPWCWSKGMGPSCGQMGCGEWIQPPLSWFPWPVSYGATLGRWGRVLSPWTWLISLISWHRGTEFWPAGSQTVLPGGRNPFHLWRHYHCPVPESKGGYHGLWGAGVGSPTCKVSSMGRARSMASPAKQGPAKHAPWVSWCLTEPDRVEGAA